MNEDERLEALAEIDEKIVELVGVNPYQYARTPTERQMDLEVHGMDLEKAVVMMWAWDLIGSVHRTYTDGQLTRMDAFDAYLAIAEIVTAYEKTGEIPDDDTIDAMAERENARRKDNDQ